MSGGKKGGSHSTLGDNLAGCLAAGGNRLFGRIMSAESDLAATDRRRPGRALPSPMTENVCYLRKEQFPTEGMPQDGDEFARSGICLNQVFIHS